MPAIAAHILVVVFILVSQPVNNLSSIINTSCAWDVLSRTNPRLRQYANIRFCFSDEGFQFFVFVAGTTDIPCQDLR